MRHKARLSKFLIERIHRDWIDRLFPQGWEMENDPHPTANEYTLSNKANSISDNNF